MKFKIYKNTKTPPIMATPMHVRYGQGYAYSISNHHVALYGSHEGLWTIQEGMTVTEGKDVPLDEWISSRFADDPAIGESLTSVGETTAHVWRPGVYTMDDLQAALGVTDVERRAAMQALRSLLEKLDELTLSIEPTEQSLHTFGQKTRDLLILACTEVENNWKAYMIEGGATPQGNDFKTVDYVKLHEPLHLSDYQVTLKAFPYRPVARPFASWSAASPTQSLPWYLAYNQTKHDRRTHFDKATLDHCISAVAANIGLFCARFSPYPLLYEGTTVSALFNHMFDVALVEPDPRNFYMPLVAFPANPNLVLSCFAIESMGLKQPWTMKPFSLI